MRPAVAGQQIASTITAAKNHNVSFSIYVVVNFVNLFNKLDTSCVSDSFGVDGRWS